MSEESDKEKSATGPQTTPVSGLFMSGTLFTKITNIIKQLPYVQVQAIMDEIQKTVKPVTIQETIAPPKA